MTTIEALENIRQAVYNRITGTCPYISDEGILYIISAGLRNVRERRKTRSHDALIAAKDLLQWHRDYMGLGKTSEKEIDEVLEKINSALENEEESE